MTKKVTVYWVKMRGDYFRGKLKQSFTFYFPLYALCFLKIGLGCVALENSAGHLCKSQRRSLRQTSEAGLASSCAEQNP
jgi:hypothetical protein